MDVEPSVAALGSLIGAPARASILSALFDGRALTATELAAVAGITPQTTSSHLNKLVDARLIVVEQHGRFRYFKLAGPQVAEALEPLTLISPHKPVPARGRSPAVERLQEARFCYDHIAGKLGVVMTAAMVEKGFLREDGRDFDVTSPGREFYESLGIDIDRLKVERRAFARKCLDWSERKSHLSGSLGAAVASLCISNGWLKRARSGRQLTVSETGRRALKRKFGVDF